MERIELTFSLLIYKLLSFKQVSVPKQPACEISRHTSCHLNESDLHPFTFHPVLCVPGKKGQQDIDHNTDFVHYLSLQHAHIEREPEENQIDAEKPELQSDWSYPVRLSANENGSRMTGSIQVVKEGCSVCTPLCITGHVKNGISYFVIREDTAPACYLKNKCPFKLVYGQTLMNLSLSGMEVLCSYSTKFPFENDILLQDQN